MAAKPASLPSDTHAADEDIPDDNDDSAVSEDSQRTDLSQSAPTLPAAAPTASASANQTELSGAANFLAQLIEAPDSTVNKHIATLKEQRERLNQDTKRIAVDIRNAERKRGRLRARARLLTPNDLLEVYAMRVRAAKESEHAAAEEIA